MQSDQELFNHRRFLQWIAAGAAAVGTQYRPTGASAQESPQHGERQAPAHPITLRSSEFEVVLDPDSGLPYEYRLLKNNARLRGEDFGLPISVTVCRKQPWSFTTSALTTRTFSREASRI